MRTKLRIKGFVLAICFLAFGFSVVGNDTIRFTWIGHEEMWNNFELVATNGKQFTVDWGNGIVETKMGTDDYQIIKPAYANEREYHVVIAGVTPDCLFTALYCHDLELSRLDVSGCTALRKLYCSANRLTDLDLSKNKYLRILYCSGNHLTNLDLKVNIVLRDLYCGNNLLTDLKLIKNTELRVLDCSNNQLTSLDLRANMALEELYCCNNRLTVLDMQANRVLWMVDCSENQLTDFFTTRTLQYLYCNDNHLTNLNLNEYIALKFLHCENNQLSALDLSKNIRLEYLDCSRNQLISLKLSKTLISIACYNNYLQLSDLYNISEMIGESYKKLGTQIFPSQMVAVGGLIDFSVQKEFGNIATVFTIKKDSLPADIDDYSIENGVITFYNTGIYIVTMTNEAIISNINYPAQVIAEIQVVADLGIIERLQDFSKINIYPNPTNDMIHIKTAIETIPEVKLYSSDGRLLQYFRSTEFDMSKYSAGIYFIQIDEKWRTIIKN